MNVRLFELINARLTSSLFESGVAVVFLVGMLTALIFRPQQITSPSLLRMACFFFALAFVLPGLTEAIAYRNCQSANIQLKETESISITAGERSGTRSNDSESSLTGLDPLAYVPLGQVAGNILLALGVYCGVVSLCPRKIEVVPPAPTRATWPPPAWPADAHGTDTPPPS